jgi:hypothetical protein
MLPEQKGQRYSGRLPGFSKSSIPLSASMVFTDKEIRKIGPET